MSLLDATSSDRVVNSPPDALATGDPVRIAAKSAPSEKETAAR